MNEAEKEKKKESTLKGCKDGLKKIKQNKREIVKNKIVKKRQRRKRAN